MNQIRKIWILTALMLIIGIIPLWAVPNRPNLLAPADKDSCVTKLIMFVWQQEASINNYSLQIASDAAFNTMICDEQMTATFINYNLPDYNTKYWWRVIVSYQNGTKDTSDVHSFKVKYSAPTDVYPADIQNCVARGICKVNFATELRNAYTEGVREALALNPSLYDPKEFGIAGRAKVRQLVAQRMIVCGSAGKARG